MLPVGFENHHRPLPSFLCLCLLLCHVSSDASVDASLDDITGAQLAGWFSGPSELGTTVADATYRLVYVAGSVVGAVFITARLSPIPGYSGRPVALLVAIDSSAKIVGVRILHHEEPILVLGLGARDLQNFTGQFLGRYAYDKVRVNAHDRPGYIGVDGLSGATITSLVINRSIMSATKTVAATLGWPRIEALPGAGVSRSAVPTPVVVPGQVSEMSSGNRVVDYFSSRMALWEGEYLKAGLLALGLAALLCILFFQDWLVARPVLFQWVRNGYLLFTVVFVGYVFAAQLSILNILAFLQTVRAGFTWETLVLDPGLFLLWSFIAVFILLWGRGVFCGWLCPFGAAQELIHNIGLRLGVPSFEFPAHIHERLWAVKYFILIFLVGISFDSFTTAAILAEVEPFKTTFSMYFMRDWGYVSYAVGLLVISLFNSKFFCKYLCSLGAALSLLGRFHVFDWLRRRRACGNPCQVCATQCQISAISPSGSINVNECHYCLQCQVTYLDEHICPPLVEKRKRREKRRDKAAVFKTQVETKVKTEVEAGVENEIRTIEVKDFNVH